VTLTEFLLARIAEDEADLPEPSSSDYCDALTGVHYSNERIRAECETKRRIVEEHEPGELLCSWSHDSSAVHDDDPCLTLRLLALPYTDHDDYQQEWKESVG